jgi:hypothetical protein
VLAGDLDDGLLLAEHLHDLLREHLPDRLFKIRGAGVLSLLGLER